MFLIWQPDFNIVSDELYTRPAWPASGVLAGLSNHGLAIYSNNVHVPLFLSLCLSSIAMC